MTTIQSAMSTLATNNNERANLLQALALSNEISLLWPSAFDNGPVHARIATKKNTFPAHLYPTQRHLFYLHLRSSTNERRIFPLHRCSDALIASALPKPR